MFHTLSRLGLNRRINLPATEAIIHCPVATSAPLLVEVKDSQAMEHGRGILHYQGYEESQCHPIDDASAMGAKTFFHPRTRPRSVATQPHPQCPVRRRRRKIARRLRDGEPARLLRW